MSFNPRTDKNLRIRAFAGRYILEQVAVVARRGRSDEMADQLADTPEIGTEAWRPLEVYVDLNAAVLDAFVMMMESDFQTRLIETERLPASVVQRALDQLRPFTVPA